MCLCMYKYEVKYFCQFLCPICGLLLIVNFNFKKRLLHYMYIVIYSICFSGKTTCKNHWPYTCSLQWEGCGCMNILSSVLLRMYYVVKSCTWYTMNVCNNCECTTQWYLPWLAACAFACFCTYLRLEQTSVCCTNTANTMRQPAVL